MQVQGYEVVERLHAGRTTAVFRALRTRDRQAVVLKMQHGDAAADPRWLRREFELTQKAHGTSVIQALGLLNIDGATAIAFEDVGGRSLDRLLGEQRLTIEQALALAIEVADALAWIHQRGLIHKDINPSNLLVTGPMRGMRLIDFGLASTLQRENVEARSARRLEGTLAYIAPEQTGRINRGVDSRADLYSFGVTLYEMLSGRLPFASQDALELVHAHVALPAPTLVGVPARLDALVRRLMAKLPEDRYQTAEGAAHDLRRILDGVRGGVAAEFELGEGDLADKLVLPEKLYGRDAPRDALLGAIDRVSRGSAEWFGVKGPSGIGKSRLVAEVLRPLLKTRGYLGAGKHDQLHQQRPCAGLTAALGQCVRQILGESPEMVEHFRGRIRGELGAEARLVVDELPELGVLLGETTPVAPLTGQEAQNRFVAVMRRFVGALASREHPLVLFLDDLQWADATTFRLLSDFLTDPESRYLLLIAAYRDDEVDGLHPLTRAVGELKAQGVTVDEHALLPLTQAETEQFLADALRRDAADTRAIAEVLRQKTGGNPFFLGQLLKTLHEGGQIRLDPGRRRFSWDEAEMRRIAVADNVVGLMTASLSKLPAITLDAVRLASCLGAEFSLEDLSAQRSLDEMFERLGPALEAGYLEPVGDSYAGAAAEARFRFAHDRVQQAAYSLLSDDARLDAHLLLGRALARRAGEHPEQAILAADHLNRALPRLTDPDERRRLVALNRTAGERASAAGVFDAAYRYLRAALDAFPSPGERASSEGFELLLDAASAALLSGEREASSALVDEALAAAPGPYDKARALFTRVSALTTELPMSKALDCGLQALELLGVSIPRDTGKVGVLKTFGQLRLGLRGIDWQVASLPLLRDPRLLLATRLLTRLQGVAFEVSPDLFMVAAFRLLLLSLEQGVSASTPPALGTVAIVLGPAFGDWSNALRCREQALSLLERPECAPSHGYCRYTFSYFIEPWVFPLHEAIPPLQESVRASMSAGDHEATGYLLFASLLHRICVGEVLDEIHHDIPALQRRLRRVSPLVYEWLRAPFQAVENLRQEGAGDPCELVGDFSTSESFQNLVRQNNRYGLALYRCQRVHLLALFQRHEEVLTVTAEVEKSADVLLGQVYLLRAQAYAAIAGYALAAEAPLARRPALLAKAALRHRAVEGAARRAPFNFAQLAELLKAERAAATGSPSSAISAYERAIAAARDNRLPQDEALACERLGRFFLARSSVSTALPFLRSARLAYMRWGARAKVKALDAEFPSIASSQHGTLDTTISTSMSAGEALDFRSLMKAAHAVSSELSLDTLLPRFARIALENAGAHRCQLFLSTDNGLVHVATAEGVDPTSRRAIPLDQAVGFARGAVAYVHRTGEQLLVADARITPPWAADPHVQQNNIRSILSLPLRHQGHRVGVIYLEKDASSGDFPRERIELLELLSSQAGSAIEIAQLYASLEHKVEERTAALSASLRQVVETQHQLAGELADASHFVRSLLPAPLSGKVRSSWVFEPSAQLGGDALGHQWLDDQRLAVYLLDACGHGVKASLLSISVLSSLNNRRLPGVDFSDPSAVLDALNRTFPAADHGGLFFTIWYGVIDFSSRQVRFASAGHPPALLLQPGSPPVELNSEGAIVGVIPDLAYPSRTEPFPPGSRLVVFSDGVYEIEGPDGQMMRYEEFVERVARSREGSLAEIVAFARSMRGGRDLEDDVSLVEIIG